MTAFASGTQSPNSTWIRGGSGAPGRARSHVLAQLEGRTPGTTASDAALIVTELVTNSVLHADVGVHRVVILELTTLDDRLRIAVTDPGALAEPRMLASDPGRPGGFGLRVVDAMCSAWGVVRDAAGQTRVWCELPLHSGPTVATAGEQGL